MNYRAASGERASARWELFVDTGGTFTDCLALDPAGGAHRAKVLSSGVVRAVVERQASERALELRPTGSVRGAELFVGWRVRLSAGGAERLIVAVEPGTWRIELDEPIGVAGVAPAGAMVDLLTGEEAPVLALRLMAGVPMSSPLPRAAMRLATTRGTNALLEGAGSPAALFVTRGFGDLLEIGDQSRPDLFAIDIVKPEPVCRRVIEVDERLDAAGNVLRPIDLDSIERAVAALRRDGIESAAIALMHSYINPAHELALAARLRELGMAHVSVSSELAPLIKILQRAQTSAVDATLSPILSDYVARVHGALGAASSLKLMTSAGGMVEAKSFRAKDGLLSGPAGGVVGALAAAKGVRGLKVEEGPEAEPPPRPSPVRGLTGEGVSSGSAREVGSEYASGNVESVFTRVIGLDMGGTSTDAARLDGAPEIRSEHAVGSVRVFAPALTIETVAAGGGSICGFEQDVLTVGPASAGANPGPACYGVGGPLTLTDVNLLLGRVAPEMFEIPVSIEAAEAALEVMRTHIAERTGSKPARAALLEGFLSVANQRMAEGIARVSVRYGYDPAEYALVAFGGAGAQHACAIAELLGMRTIIMPAEASLLSALGLAHAPVERVAQRQVLEQLDVCAARLERVFRELEAEAETELAVEGAVQDVRTRRFAELRLAGQETALTVECEQVEALAEQFAEAYRAMYGHTPAPAPGTAKKLVEVAAVRVVMSMPGREGARLGAALAKAVVKREVDGRTLCAGDVVKAGMVISGGRTSCVVDQGWRGVVDEGGAIVLRRERCEDASVRGAGRAAPAIVRAALVGNRLSSIAEMMGEQLRRTAVSTNVKERLDFSCAILDAAGSLVVSAAHIPVHLGALGHCVRAVIERWRAQGRRFQPGDVVVTNHPAFGGSHLPDVTVVTPVFAGGAAPKETPTPALLRARTSGGGGREGDELIGFTASRAHHAEIGGVRPGSMPARATRLFEEGVVIEPMLLVEAGEERFDDVEALLRGGPWPSRAVSDNIADLRAAVSANHRGAALLAGLAGEIGAEEFRGHLARVMDRSERLVREALVRVDTASAEPPPRPSPVRPRGAFGGGRMERNVREVMDDGSAICVRVETHGDAVTIDFTGTAGVHPGNLNATPAIVHSAVMYVMRLLVDEAVPMNDGLMRAVRVVLPSSMLNPEFDVDARKAPAVVGGNVETSQRVVDALLTAFGVCACSQGTMNNVLFGTERWAYYETICGGAGASRRKRGADAVHTHMTNTRITDPEVFEQRYPARLERFAVRRNSGGAGAHPGGDGVVREITFLEPVQLSLLTQRRATAPHGIAGGGDGLPGAQRLVRANGEVEVLGPIDEREVQAGDRLIVETPGGGGFGMASSADVQSRVH